MQLENALDQLHTSLNIQSYKKESVQKTIQKTDTEKSIEELIIPFNESDFELLPLELKEKVLLELVPTSVIQNADQLIDKLQKFTNIGQPNKAIRDVLSDEHFMKNIIKVMFSKIENNKIIEDAIKKIRDFRNPYDPSFRIRILPVFQQALKNVMNKIEMYKKAVDSNRKEVENLTKELIEKNYLNPNFFIDDNAFLHNAVKKDFSGLIDYLIEKGANIHAKNKKFETPLLIALKNDPQLALELMKKYKNVRLTDESSFIIRLLYFNKDTYMEAIKKLIKKSVKRGLSPNADNLKSAQFRTPLLIWAIDIAESTGSLRGNLDLIEFLLKRGADPELEYVDHSENIDTPLNYAKDYPDIIALMNIYKK